MICRYYGNSGERFETRDMRVYISRTRRPTKASTSHQVGMGPILHYGPKHSLVFFVYADGEAECLHVKG